jgi:uncharacterized protein (TIGR02594 family)
MNYSISLNKGLTHLNFVELLTSGLKENPEVVKEFFEYTSQRMCTPKGERFYKLNGRLFELFRQMESNTEIKKQIYNTGNEVLRVNFGKRILEYANNTAQWVPDMDKSGELPKWLRLAYEEIHVTEISGKEIHNPRIIEYFSTTQHKSENDETPWCAAFVSWCFQQSQHTLPELSSWSLAWRNWGTRSPTPVYGGLAVIDWNGKNGHIGFTVGLGKSGNQDTIALLGGNQRIHGSKDKEGRTINISTYKVGSKMTFIVPPDYIPTAFDKIMLPLKMASEDIGTFANTR